MNAPRTRVQRRPVHGVLLLDKPIGLSSNQALQKAKWLLRAEKAGHTGTLDPLATGVLPLCFGAATKFSQLHLDADKVYEAVARLGVKTSTGDAEGEVVERRLVSVGDDDLARVAARFTGAIRQVPPMHSALKKDGKALYEYAREGVEVERAPRDVVIHGLSIERDGDDLRIRATVSKGTYIRTLAEDIGEALGCGAHLVALRRVATGGFEAGQCVTLEALEAMSESDRLARLLPVEALVADHTRVTLGAEDAGRFLTGLRRRGDWADAPAVAVFGPLPPHPNPLPGGATVCTHFSRHSREGGNPRTLEMPMDSRLRGNDDGGNAELCAYGSPGGEKRKEPSVFLGTAHIQSRELIPGRLLSPLEIQQILLTHTP